MEQLFLAYLDNATPSQPMIAARDDDSASSAIKIIRTNGVVVTAEQNIEPASPPVMGGLKHVDSEISTLFEDTLADTDVYRRVRRPLDTFSAVSIDNRSSSDHYDNLYACG